MKVNSLREPNQPDIDRQRIREFAGKRGPKPKIPEPCKTCCHLYPPGQAFEGMAEWELNRWKCGVWKQFREPCASRRELPTEGIVG